MGVPTDLALHLLFILYGCPPDCCSVLVPSAVLWHRDEDPTGSKACSLNHMCKSLPLYEFYNVRLQDFP